VNDSSPHRTVWQSRAGGAWQSEAELSFVAPWSRQERRPGPVVTRQPYTLLAHGLNTTNAFNNDNRRRASA